MNSAEAKTVSKVLDLGSALRASLVAAGQTPPPEEPEVKSPAKRHALHLYEALEALDILDDLIDEHAEAITAAGGDIEAVPEIAELLAFAEVDLEKAVERLGLKVRTLLAEMQGAKVEADRLAGVVSRKKNAAERVKEFLRRNLESRGIQKVKTPLVTVRTQINSAPSVRAEGERTIEDLYAQGSPFIARKVIYEIDREAVLAAWKVDTAARTELRQSGGDPASYTPTLPKGIVVDRGSHVRID